MTLIITAISNNTIYQVSDRLLTVNGNSYNPNANKAICVAGQDSQIVMAYTGLAEFTLNGKSIPTDELIIDYLSQINAGFLQLEDILKHLAAYLARQISLQVYESKYLKLALVVAGFVQDQVVTGGVSNFEKEDGSLIPIQKGFNWWVKRACSYSDTAAGFIVNGVESVVDDTFWSEIEKKGRRIVYEDQSKVVRRLTNFVRWASKDKIYGKYIGKDCMVTVLKRNEGFESYFCPFNKKPILHAPHVIFGGVSMKNIMLRYGSE